MKLNKKPKEIEKTLVSFNSTGLLLKSLMSGISAICPETVLQFAKNGIKVNFMDAVHVTMCHIFISSMDLDDYLYMSETDEKSGNYAESVDFGINAAYLLKFLKKMTKKSTVRIQIVKRETGRLRMKIIHPNVTYMRDALEIEPKKLPIQQLRDIPTTEELEINTKAFNTMLLDVGLLTDRFGLRFDTDNDYIEMTNAGYYGEDVESKIEDYTPKTDFECEFTVKKLKACMKFAKFGQQIVIPEFTMKTGDDRPMYLTMYYPETDDRSYIEIFIAPRVDSQYDD